MRVRISVRNLVEFILRSGSIDSAFTGRNRMEEGARVHRKLQKADGYQAEVFLSITDVRDEIVFLVEGRADGIISDENGVTVDEIKSTLTPLEQIGEDFSQLHWAQAMCYGHIYCVKNELERINIRLTYYEMETGGIKRFTRDFTAEELQEFFADLIDKYAVWAKMDREWKELSGATMRGLGFPYEEYREGQRKLAAAVYKTIAAKSRLFAMAPTGVGKTISTLFPAIKAMGEGIGAKIFYLTAKTVTRQAARAALDKMRESGLRVKSVTITAKEKICFLPGPPSCRPSLCEYADGHFDRINDAIMEMLLHCDSITAETVAEYAARHRVCPFELSLDVTLWCDVIICDYNYLFDPQVYLRRFFADAGDYIFLVDEAHNLCDRAREMYSTSVGKRELLAAAKLLKENRGAAAAKTLRKINKLLIEKRKECADTGFIIGREVPEDLLELLRGFALEFSDWLTLQSNDALVGRDAPARRTEQDEPPFSLLETYFHVLSFLKIAELYDERYATLYETGYGGELTVKLYCADPSHALDERFSCGRAAILFSATLTPPGYFKDVLGGGEDSKYLALPSPFPRGNMLLMIEDGVSTRYRDYESSLELVADLIFRAASGKPGKYIAYFPSYKYLTSVYTIFAEKYPETNTYRQERGMAESERDAFLARFEEQNDAMVAFCVLGGVFSEGIDLPGDRLIGTVIVGVGLPRINTELDIVRDQYGGYGRGFDFAYRYPGMNKVLQAAGRVIRSGEDRGVVLLIDDRFASRQYSELFPEHWRGARIVRGPEELAEALRDFWQENCEL